MNKNSILKKYFGYNEFRPLQSEIIEEVLNKRDVLVIMPTGGGKSICYQIPAIMQPGLTLVVSPLIALMKDQVEGLKANGVQAAFLNSSLAPEEQDRVLWAAKLGELKLLYIAPERIFSGNTLPFLQELGLSLIAVDEAHCISSWGHDFRPEYRQLSVLRDYFPGVPVLALTATADKVTRRDICKQLNIDEENIYISSFDRPNLSLEVLPGRQRIKQIQQIISKMPNTSGIIYCLSRKSTENVAEDLNSLGFKAKAYHAGMDAAKRSKVQEMFITEEVPIIVATIAFGMGIDKSNVRWIIHYNMPGNVEGFYQEIGRAGRDGLPAKTILFYSFADVIQRNRMIQDSEMPDEQKELMNAKLERMRQYAEANICRRRILISYFNEDIGKNCGNCDVCKNPRRQFDATVIAQKALSAIVRTNQSVALTNLVDILRGSRNQTILKAGFDQIPTFGVGKDLRSEVWYDYILQLLNYGAFDIAYDEGHVFKLNEVSWQILKGHRKVEISEYISPAERQAEQEEEKLKASPRKSDIIRNELFEKLRILRKQIADAMGVPPYVVFNDATLSEMAQKKPISEAQFKAVSGVGQEKFRRYGEVFIKEILEFIKSKSDEKISLPKGLTYEVTYELFKEGMSIEEIVQQRGFTAGTIASHLIKMKENGADIDLSKLIDSWDLNAIVDAAKELKYLFGEPLKPIFEHFEGNVDYGKIRLALAIWQEDESRT